MSYHISREGQQLGTFSEEEVLEGLDSGKILPTDELWTEGMDDWQPVSEVIEPDEDEPEEAAATEPLHAEEEASLAREPAPLLGLEAAETQIIEHRYSEPEEEPEPVPVVPMPAPVVVHPPVVATPAQPAAVAQPVVVYRTVGPSLQPGQYGIAGSAIASMVLGILSLVTCFFTGVPAIICGHMARGKIRRTGGVYSGDGLAVTGLIFGYVTSAIGIVVVVLAVAGVHLPLPQMMQGFGKERQVRSEAAELSRALKRCASAHASKFPPNLDALVQEHYLDKARLEQLQRTDLGDSWKGPPGWNYMAAGQVDTDAGDAPLLISHESDGTGHHLVVYQDGTLDTAEIRTK